jgi:ribosomal subunit interface protein
MNRSTQTQPAPSYFNLENFDPGIPVKVQFRHMPESKRVLGVIDQMMEKFEKYPLPGAQVTVVVDETHHRESKGVFQVKIKLFVPGERLYVAQSMERTGMHDGVYAALSSVFESIERQLVKSHGRRAQRRMHRIEEQAA